MDKKDQPRDAVQKSKSEVKRDLQALRDLGKELMALPAATLRRLPVSEILYDALLAAKTFKRQALRRQIGHIGVLLRKEDVDAIRQALVCLVKPHQEAVQGFHELETWRDHLLAGDQVLLDRLVADFSADRQVLRQLIRNANKEKALDKPPKAARKLFQLLRTLRNL